MYVDLRTQELHYPIIQFLINLFIQGSSNISVILDEKCLGILHFLNYPRLGEPSHTPPWSNCHMVGGGGGQPDFVISIALKNFMILKLDLAKSIFIDNFYPISRLLPSCGVLIDDVVTKVTLI